MSAEFVSEMSGGGLLTNYKALVSIVVLIVIIVVVIFVWKYYFSGSSKFVSVSLQPGILGSSGGRSSTGNEDWFVVLCDGCVESANQIRELPRPFNNYVRIDTNRNIVSNLRGYDLSKYKIERVPMWINRVTGDIVRGFLPRERLQEIGILV